MKNAILQAPIISNCWCTWSRKNIFRLLIVSLSSPTEREREKSPIVHITPPSHSNTLSQCRKRLSRKVLSSFPFKLDTFCRPCPSLSLAIFSPWMNLTDDLSDGTKERGRKRKKNVHSLHDILRRNKMRRISSQHFSIRNKHHVDRLGSECILSLLRLLSKQQLLFSATRVRDKTGNEC